MCDNKILTVFETSPDEGVFFSKREVQFDNLPEDTEDSIINIFDDVKYQEILGFGGAFTESSAYLYSLLSDEDKKRFLELYFDRESGIGYNFGRTHINSCDFSLSPYSSVEDGDKTLNTFNIKREQKYILPFLKDVLAYCNEEIVLFASPWSPPAYMKDNDNMFGGGKLKEEYKAVWANYYAKYIKAMAGEGVKISAISVQNEPIAVQTWESCFYSADDECEFIEKHLIPALDAENLSDIKIIIWDHNKERVYDRAKKVLSNAHVDKRVWAVGYHWYSGDHFEGLALVHEKLHKPLICSEFCGSIRENPHMLAERYAVEICENLNHFTIASCDWNLLLDQNGGPYHNRTAKTDDNQFEKKDDGCYAPVLYDTENKELIVTPIYYYIGHFSKLVKRGAVRIATTKYTRDLYTCAFLNPDGSKICVVINTSDNEKTVNLRYQGNCTGNRIKAHSIITFVF